MLYLKEDIYVNSGVWFGFFFKEASSNVCNVWYNSVIFYTTSVLYA